MQRGSSSRPIHQTPCSIMAVFLLNNTIDTFDTNRHTSLSI